MQKKQDNRTTNSCICNIDSSNTTATRAPVYNSPVSIAIENPFQRIYNELYEIKMMLRFLMENNSKPVEKLELMGLQEACEMLQMSSSSIYKMTAKNSIPFIKREGSKKLLFSRAKLLTWLEESQANPISIEEQIDEHLHRKLRVRKIQNN